MMNARIATLAHQPTYPHCNEVPEVCLDRYYPRCRFGGYDKGSDDDGLHSLDKTEPDPTTSSDLHARLVLGLPIGLGNIHEHCHFLYASLGRSPEALDGVTLLQHQDEGLV